MYSPNKQMRRFIRIFEIYFKTNRIVNKHQQEHQRNKKETSPALRSLHASSASIALSGIPPDVALAKKLYSMNK